MTELQAAAEQIGGQRLGADVVPDQQTQLRLEALVKSYGRKRVVDRVSLHVDRGEIVGLLGPNGAGKTTSFYMAVGLIQPDEGHVFLNGMDISRMPMYKRARNGICYLPQEASIFRKLSVEENVLAILETLKLTPEEEKKRLQVLLADLGITHIAKNRASSLSGGERRRGGNYKGFSDFSQIHTAG